MNSCYLCGRVLSEHPANSGECQCHDEHIIPNAIGGHLTDRHILCKDCGGNLSESSDSGFTDIFAPFIVQMQEAGILKHLDRNNNSKRLLGGFIFADKTPDSPKEEIKYNKGAAIPVVPHSYIDDDNKVVDIYAEKKTARNLVNKIKGELKNEGKDPDDYKYKIHSDLMSEGFLSLNFTNGKPNFNKDFESGILKIAVEMALHFGIPREQLTSALYINSKTGRADFKKNVPIWPFIPQSLPDMIYESERYRLEPNYPSHTVKVFSELRADGKKNIFCYIDLFSTFQYYVLLGDSYEGVDVDFTYAQKLRPNYMTKLEELQYMSPRDLDIELQQLKIPRSWIDHKTLSEIAKTIYEEYRKKRSEFDMYKPLGCIYDSISIQVLLLFMNNDAIKKMIDLDLSAVDIAQKVIALEGLSPDDVRSICLQQCTEEYFRKILLEKENKKIVGLSYPNETYKISNKHPVMVREYTMTKFQQLSYLCFKESDKSR